MTVTTFLLLVAAGIGTGLLGYLTGLASLVSYPALLAAGLSPVAANVSNTLGLVGVGVGSTLRGGAVVMQRGAGALIRQLIITAAGGLVGGGLLLAAGDGVFEAIVPWLILIASISCYFSPQLRALHGDGESTLVYSIGLFLISIYGGFFGAGAGVIFLALALVATSETLERAMMLKTVLLGVSNLVAALLFIVFGPVNWLAAVSLGIGCTIGGNLGPVVQRRIPEAILRTVVALSGVGLAVWLWIQR